MSANERSDVSHATISSITTSTTAGMTQSHATCENHAGRLETITAATDAGRLEPDKVDERVFARHLYVPELGDADMLWRTSGEHRLSNYVLWQAAYAELVFTDILWPDVDRLALWNAIEIYARRDRRFGQA